MRHLKKFNQLNEIRTISQAIGSLAGKLQNSFKGDYQPGRKKNDDDLAKEILEYINQLNRSYNPSTNFNIRQVNTNKENSFFVVGEPFKRTQETYLINVSKHIDHRTKNIPEYTVEIAKNKPHMTNLDSDTPKERDFGGLGKGLRLSGELKKNIQRNASPNFEKTEVLQCNQNLSKQIWIATHDLYSEVTRTQRGDARGGSNY